MLQLQTERERQLEHLRKQIVACRECSRLVRFREQIAKEKKRKFKDFRYWGRPVPSFGDSFAELIVIGLAPAAHGGNRTGRVFTGDNSARFLMRHLYEAGFANQPTSETRDDGLRMIDCYISAAVRCVPPDNKPTTLEMGRCSKYLATELRLMKDAKAILALGKIAFDSIIRFAREEHGVKGSFRFEHGEKYFVAERFPVLFASYHPSPRNTNTGKLTSQMFSSVLSDIRSYLRGD